MHHRKYITNGKYKTSTQKDEYEYLYKEEGELKGNENEGIVEYGGFYKL